MEEKETFLRWDENQVVGYLMKEPWVLDIAENPKRSSDDYAQVLYDFIKKYYMVQPSDIVPQDFSELFAIARKHRNQIILKKNNYEEENREGDLEGRQETERGPRSTE